MNLKVTESTVVTTIISSPEGRNTYEIRKDFIGLQGKTAVIMMLFPGTSDENILKVDNTTQSLIDHIEELGFKRLRIVNLFSKVCSARMSVKNIQADLENLEYITAVMKEAEAKDYEWIIAWGSSMTTSKVANQMKKKLVQEIREYLPNVVLKQFMVDNLEDMQNEGALHPLFLKIRYSSSSWHLENYNIPKEMLLPDEDGKNEKQKSKKSEESKEQQSNKEESLTEKVKKQQTKGNPKYVIQD